MILLSLKEVLLDGLKQALFCDYEENERSFTNFSYIDSSKSHFSGSSECGGSSQNAFVGRTIPLQKKQNIADVFYVSAVPQLLLAKFPSIGSSILSKRVDELGKKGNEISQISDWAVSQLKQVSFQPMICEVNRCSRDLNLRAQLWDEFQIETQRSGWISFCLSHKGVGIWLQQVQALLKNSYLRSELIPDELSIPAHPQLKSARHNSAQLNSAQASLNCDRHPPSLPAETLLWPVQYTYMRCCTVLRLWHQLNPALAALDSTSAQTSAQIQAWVKDAPSRQLIHALIEITDDMFWIPYRWPSEQYFLLLKRSPQLCQAFERFYAERLSGFGQFSQLFCADSPAGDIPQWRANFYLVTVTKNVLKVLLNQNLEAEAPADL